MEARFSPVQASEGPIHTCAQDAVTFLVTLPSFGSHLHGYLVSSTAPSSRSVFQFKRRGKRKGHRFLLGRVCVFIREEPLSLETSSYISLVRTCRAWLRESRKSILFRFYSFNSRDDKRFGNGVQISQLTVSATDSNIM